MMKIDCLFCKIAEGSIPATIVYQDELCLAFEDIHPQAPFHVLVIPRKHIESLSAADKKEDQALLGHLMGICGSIARNHELVTSGFRVVANTGSHGGQTVFHLHLHVLGGRPLSWPPG